MHKVDLCQILSHFIVHHLSSSLLLFLFAQEAYYLQVFPLVYQWTSSHHFIVRLYSQQAVFRMWAEFSSLPLLRKHFEVMESLVSIMKQIGYIILSAVSATELG